MVAAPRFEAGKIRLGCLFVVAVVVLAVYVGKDVGAVYWRYYQMEDEVKSEAGFASGLTDKVILDRLVATADTLGLPLGPGDWYIHRSNGPKEIVISAEYSDSVVFAIPGWRKVIHFHLAPHARADL